MRAAVPAPKAICSGTSKEALLGSFLSPEGQVLRGRTGSLRVLRGGSFNNDQRNARCAYRNRNNPNNRNNNNGFRVVLAHDFLPLPEMPGGDSFLAEASKKSRRGPSLAASRALRCGTGQIGQARPLPGMQVRAGAGNGHLVAEEVWCIAR
jgi:hypothetical protein